MTKLGAQPGVHGGEEAVEKEAIKIDPKVFTVLQPTVIPMPPAPQHLPHQNTSSFAAQAARACFHSMFFLACLLLVTFLAFYFVMFTPEMIKKIDTSSSADKPQMEALLQKQVDGSSEKRAEVENAAGIVSIPLARVVVVEDISNNNNNNNNEDVAKKASFVDATSIEDDKPNVSNLDRPLHPDEIEQFRMIEARQQFQQMMEWRMYMQQVAAARMWRMRRLQAAWAAQQQMKMAYFQQQQQQQQQMQEEAARQQWAERARYEEDQRRQWEAQRAQAFWQQHQMEVQAQQAQMWHQQQQQQQQQAPIQQNQFWGRQMQRPSVWQQPPQQFFFPAQQQQQQQQPLPEVPFQPAPEPSVHDKIYEELQKKSQNIPVNAPTRQIWTAITPTPAPEEPVMNTARVSSTPPTPDAADVSDTILRDIFSAFDEQKNSEAANKELNPSTTATPPPTPSTTSEEPELEGKGAVVIEDSFPRIEERTTTPEPVQTPSESSSSAESEESTAVATAADTDADDDHEKELDPFAAVLKFFESSRGDGGVALELPQPEQPPRHKPIVI